MSNTARPKTDRRKKTAASSKAARTAANLSGGVSEADIALRAFAYYCERGCGEGGALDDWLRAERELRGAQVSGQAS